MGRVARALPVACAVFLASLFVASSFAASIAQEAAGDADRFAVVIGAERYPDAIGVERGALADARLVGEALEAEGFAVELIEDPDEATLKRAAFSLVDQLTATGDGAVGVFYFVGAGMQLNSDTFMLPVDARTVDDLTLSGAALSGEQLSERLNTAAGATTLIVIDAASPSPLTARFDLVPGIAAIDPTDDGLVILSHYPDQVAVARQDGTSVFARAFAGLVRDAQDNFADALSDMRRLVDEESGGSRYAWISGTLNPRFTLSARAEEAEATDEAPPVLAPANDAAPGEPTPMPANREEPVIEGAVDGGAGAPQVDLLQAAD